MPKALVILSPGFPENEEDSSCIPPQQTFVKSLQRLYPDRQLVVLTFVYPFFSGTYDWHGVKVIAFGKPAAGRLHRKLTYVRGWQTLKRLRDEYELQGLLAFWLGPCAWIAARFARRHSLPFYTWLLGQDARPANKYVRRIKPAGSSLIALSDFVAGEFEKNYQIRPASVVPPGVDPALFGAGPEEKDIDVLGVGSLIPLKQFDLFIDVIGQLKRRFPALRAVICGDGPEQAALKKRARSAGLAETDLSFTGRLPHGEVLSLMQRSRILLHTSAYEGFGVVQPEALYAGASVVSFVRPMKTSVEGWFTVNGTKAMIEMVEKLLSTPELRVLPRLPFRLEDSARAIHQFFDASSARAPLTDSYFDPGTVPSSAGPGASAVAIS